MTFNIKFSQKIVALNAKKSGSASLYLQVFLNRSRIRIPLNIEVVLKNWDGLTEALIGKGELVNDTNLQLQNFKARATDIVVRYRLKNEPLDAKLFVEMLQNPFDNSCFLEYMRVAINRHRAFVAKTTITAHETIWRCLQDFNAMVPFSLIDYPWLKRFDQYLINKRNLSINTRGKYMRVIKFYMLDAKKSGFEFKNPFEHYTITQLKGNKIALSTTELELLEDLYYAPKTPADWRHVLQYYLFSCYTGLRYSDYSKIKCKNFVDGHLIFNQQKISKKRIADISVPILYKARQFYNTQGEVFTRIYSMQYSNRILSEVAAHLKLNKKVTLHTGRHSCGTLLARLSMPTASIMEFLGHSKMDQTMEYVHLSKSDIKPHVENINEQLKVISPDRRLS